ncbi:hypothetical protein [Yersinia enterocolitica]|uniref:hypothetical protein n=1 Tax=Yersinia enterocolitica TaxID=630 RepID=UPI001C60D0A3|nr:hypothetical protein [Yersinia enterocolitica]MBW5875996.1 hypothetical protein [Yersinia enterocolitica]
MSNKTIFGGIEARANTLENNPFSGRGAMNVIANSGYTPTFCAGIARELEELAPVRFAVVMPDEQGGMEAAYFSNLDGVKRFCREHKFPAFFELKRRGDAEDFAWIACGDGAPKQFNFGESPAEFSQRIPLSQLKALADAESSPLKSAMLKAAASFASGDESTANYYDLV